MLQKLKSILGINKKYTREELIQFLPHFVDKLTEVFLEDMEISNEIKNKSKSEMKIFFWFISTPIIQTYANSELADTLMNHFRENIIFSDIDEMLYEDNYLIEILTQRANYYNNYLSGKIPTMALQDEIRRQDEILTTYPLESIDLNSPMPMDFNFLGGFSNKSDLYDKTLRMKLNYEKELKKILKLTKQNVV
ncbi:hypothetical protein [Lacinutrix venerupis]|uniref:Uncharacterized protein n=1 Tax=Lacinutrix venerupis TaxID=1486034 RepID=A0AAC9LME9_9FLAO|nr:hypothetical protein [Lacinutrix venerupis]APY00050.1 hypothetical protein BWR22_06915 [Lacinutrix venerupis]